jgi:hypothetical protein
MPKNLLLVLFILIYKLVPAQLTYQTLQVDYDSAKTFKNLKIIPIRFKGPGDGRMRPEVVSLSNAIQQGLAVVSERGTASTENVHWLRINNNSDKAIFVGSGEVILGGRQDRMVTRDTVLMPSRSDQYISVMCVEEGRWSDKEKKFAYFNYATPQLRKVLDQSNNQVVVWREILNHLDFNGVNSPTLAYASRRADKKFAPLVQEYYNYFIDQFKRSDSTITGFVCMSGDKVIGTDIYAGTNLFYGQLEALLPGYIEEAISYGKTVTIKDAKVKEYLDRILTDEESQKAYLKKNGKIYRYKEKVIHITGYGE